MNLNSPDARAQIDRELGRFLQQQTVTRVFTAEGTLAPPPLAYMVSFPRLSITLSGVDRVELERDGRWQLLRAARGDAVFVPANVPNRPTWSGCGTVLTMLFGRRHTGISLVRSAGRAGGTRPVLKTQIQASPESPTFASLAALSALLAREPDNPAGHHLVMAMMHTARLFLKRGPQAAGTKANRTYQSLCLYAQEHFHLPLTRESVSAQFGLSPSHVSRLFRQQGMMTFGEYLNWARIDRAKLLLRRHDFSIDEVATRCGYRDASYFCRVFKNGTKLTPTQYRVSGVATPTIAAASRRGE